MLRWVCSLSECAIDLTEILPGELLSLSNSICSLKNNKAFSSLQLRHRLWPHLQRNIFH